MEKAKTIAQAFLKHFATDLAVKGILQGYLEGKTLKEIHDFLWNANLWESIPEGQRDFLLAHKPWGLEWLDLEWVLKVFGEQDVAIVSMVMTSEHLTQKLSSEIERLQKLLS